MFKKIHEYLVETFDYLFSKIAIISAHPYSIIATTNACVFGVMWFEESKVDITISIATLLLDLIIISQNNKINSSNTETLNRILCLEQQNFVLQEQILAMENNHSLMLESIINYLRPPREKNGRFAKM